MKKKRPYQSVDVKQIKVSELIGSRPGMACDVGLDCSKREVAVVVRWSNGAFERPWRVSLHEGDLPVLIEKLKELRQDRGCTVALEPTGTYCDPLRQALAAAEFRVFKIPTKVSHDYAEVFDGVPSQHDGKDAACVAELCAIGKRSEWPWNNERSELRHEIEWLDNHRRIQSRWLSQLEGELGRYWPELSGIVKLSSATALRALAHYGGPEPLSQDPQASEQLTKMGRGALSADRVQKIIESAQLSIGVKQQPGDLVQVQRYAKQALSYHQELRRSNKRVATLVRDNSVIQRLAKVIGTTTAAVCWAHLGDPNQYHSGKAYVKAMGLNLKERSSGLYQGQLKISKRGPSRPRRWLYFSALRTIQKFWVRPWYEAKKQRGPGFARRAIIAVMRKLAFAMYQVGTQDKPYSEQQLLPGAAKYHRRDSVAGSTQAKKPSRRKRERAKSTG